MEVYRVTLEIDEPVLAESPDEAEAWAFANFMEVFEFRTSKPDRVGVERLRRLPAADWRGAIPWNGATEDERPVEDYL